MSFISNTQDFFRKITGSNAFKNTVTVVILLNSVVLGLLTSETLCARFGGVLEGILSLCVIIFTIEIIMRISAYGWRFFLRGWNIFDFLLVALAIIPATGAASSFRILRVLRALRMLSAMKKLRHIISAILVAAPHVFWATVLLLIIFYIFGIIGQNLFHEAFPEWFGTLGDTLYTLFQVMTLESWSMGIARPVMKVYPWAWCYFVPFVLMSSYIVLNVVVGVVVNAVGNLDEGGDNPKTLQLSAKENVSNAEIARQIELLQKQIERLEKRLEEKDGGSEG